MFKLEKITKRDEDFAQWYTNIINNAQLVVYGDIKGSMILQPNAWSIWESIEFLINQEFKKLDIKNVALPLLIPYSEFKKETKHLQGFAPECFMVNSIGDKKLDSPYIIRPTSEILFCKYFNHITSSYKNLPIKVNQWCNVLRAEKTTKPFLRNSEFYWQELHSIFASKNEAFQFTEKIIKIYEKIVKQELCIPVMCGQKTIGERFAGADNTFTIEALMQDGQILQCGTSHYLGNNFSKIYDIKFQNKDNKFENVYQNSAGVSTRLIGAIIMVHGDDNGLVLPPAIAPTQIKINVMGLKKNPELKDIVSTLTKKLKKYRILIDDNDDGLGSKLSNGEIIGTPIQLIIGNETIQNNEVTLIRRDDLIKQKVKLDDLIDKIKNELIILKKNLYSKAKKHLDESIVSVNSIEELKEVLEQKKLAKVHWAGSEADEQEVKKLTGATPRVIIGKEKSKCFFTKKDSEDIVIFGRAY